MAIPLSKIRNTSTVKSAGSASNIYEARALRMKTAFLCHSHKDKDLVEKTALMLKRAGWNVYIDWADDTMPIKPNQETAKKIQTKIKDSNYFLFLATSNSTSSKWCPWEIGYADGVKSLKNILIIPTKEDSSDYGTEYLDLYNRIDIDSSGDLKVYEATRTFYGTPLRDL